ncbi:hypothetical protein BW685_20965 [Burkholderia ubonensis]|uniref:Uncharacterized protein n=1 Tax=Burkholderia ubonensis TaxID=101571 RepID=A0A1R1J842_9BURK|nr:hypothetical protein BW685_20965 [Burkholderia ubonensis]
MIGIAAFFSIHNFHFAAVRPTRGHRWHATPNTIRQGHWCARCYFISITSTEKTRRKRRHEAVRV